MAKDTIPDHLSGAVVEMTDTDLDLQRTNETYRCRSGCLEQAEERHSPSAPQKDFTRQSTKEFSGADLGLQKDLLCNDFAGTTETPKRDYPFSLSQSDC